MKKLLLLLLLIPNLVMGGFDGVDGKRVLDYLDSVTENITGEVVDNPELILAPPIIVYNQYIIYNYSGSLLDKTEL